SDSRFDRSQRLEGPATESRAECFGRIHPSVVHARLVQRQSGIHWTGIVFGLGFVVSFAYWTTDFLVVQRVLAAKDLRAAKMAPIIGAAFKMFVPFIVILPGLLGL